MGKVSVISRRDGNHSQIIAADGQHNPFPTNSSLNGPEAHQMDGQKWNDVPVPILGKPLPGSAYKGTVGMMGNFVHAEIVALSANYTCSQQAATRCNYPRKPLPGSPRLRLYQVMLCGAYLRPQILHVGGKVDLFHGPGIFDGGMVHQQFMARTIFGTSTGSEKPLRFFTRMVCCGYISSV